MLQNIYCTTHTQHSSRLPRQAAYLWPPSSNVSRLRQQRISRFTLRIASDIFIFARIWTTPHLIMGVAVCFRLLSSWILLHGFFITASNLPSMREACYLLILAATLLWAARVLLGTALGHFAAGHCTRKALHVSL